MLNRGRLEMGLEGGRRILVVSQQKIYLIPSLSFAVF